MQQSARGTVLVVEASPEAAEEVAAAIRGEAFGAVACAGAAAGLAAVREHDPVAVLVGWSLPDRPGADLCREIRARDALLPILFLSDEADGKTVARGLDAGADDFLARPFEPVELVARLEAHVRKAQAARGAGPRPGPTAPAALEAATPAQTLYRFGEVEVDLAAREVRVAGAPVGLGPLEFRLVEYLVQNAGIAISRDQIMSQVYGYDADISTERVDLLARRVRAKLGEGPGRGGHLVAVPGYGYRWERRRRDAEVQQAFS
jgi:two-component system, OmpR family, KDP operon response regulator KdpE